MRRTPHVVAALTTVLLVGCAPVLIVNQPFDASLYPEPSQDAITFWGHASVYLDVGGMGIVTDPVFESRYSPFHGRTIAKPPPEAYDQTSIILISHAHADHLHPGTLKRFSPRAIILCPAPSAKHVRDLGPAVLVMRPWEEYPFPGGKIVAVPAYHAGARWIGGPAADGRALGYVIVTPERTVYISGDTDYFAGMEEIGARFRPDLAVLNVNGHLKPADAMRATQTLGAHRVLPVHMGSYGGLAGKRGKRFREEFLALAGAKGVPLQVGQSLPLYALSPGRSSAPKRSGRPLAGPPLREVGSVEAYALRTFAAWSPLGPRTISNSSRSPSASVLNPSPEIAE
jgi:L-ascorbate metabolism protein UlaG (beta-lactamase superfamily)